MSAAISIADIAEAHTGMQSLRNTFRSLAAAERVVDVLGAALNLERELGRAVETRRAELADLQTAAVERAEAAARIAGDALLADYHVRGSAGYDEAQGKLAAIKGEITARTADLAALNEQIAAVKAHAAKLAG
jgi:hypothetical protein